MFPDWFAVLDETVAREGVGLQEHEGGEGGEHVVSDCQLRSHQLLLCLLHSNDELDDVQVSLPQFVEA